MQIQRKRLIWHSAWLRGIQLSLSEVCRWVTTTFCGFRKHGLMFEKYDATRIGETGGGGEYHPQSGKLINNAC